MGCRAVAGLPARLPPGRGARRSAQSRRPRCVRASPASGQRGTSRHQARKTPRPDDHLRRAALTGAAPGRLPSGVPHRPSGWRWAPSGAGTVSGGSLEVAAEFPGLPAVDEAVEQPCQSDVAGAAVHPMVWKSWPPFRGSRQAWSGSGRWQRLPSTRKTVHRATSAPRHRPSTGKGVTLDRKSQPSNVKARVERQAPRQPPGPRPLGRPPGSGRSRCAARAGRHRYLPGTIEEAGALREHRPVIGGTADDHAGDLVVPHPKHLSA